MAGISQLVLTFSENLSDNALRAHRKSETLDARIALGKCSALDLTGKVVENLKLQRSFAVARK